MSAATILVIEDEKDVRDLLEENLRREGFAVLTGRNGKDALAKARDRRPSLVLLDLMLPDIDGIEVCRQLKWSAETRGIPVIMVTAKGEESDVVLGLGVGAEDYIVKPFRMKELIARMRTALRRLQAAPEGTGPGPVQHGPLRVDLERHEARVEGRPLKVTPTELRILHLFVSQPGIVHSRPAIIEKCCAGEGDVSEHIVDVYIQLLRRKLGVRRGLIQTIRGAGYRLVDVP